MTAPAYVWQQIEDLLQDASHTVALVCPFIKNSTFEAFIAAVPPSVRQIRCFTRWAPAEVAAGVSDPEIIEACEHDTRIRISLCPPLHAKIYIADDRCLIGSANLTEKATGRAPHPNIEVLVDTTAEHPEVKRVLGVVEATSIEATPQLAALLRKQAHVLTSADTHTGAEDEHLLRKTWYPLTRQPAHLYAFYAGRRTFTPGVEEGLLHDLAHLNIPLGLDEEQFNIVVQERLNDMPEVHELTTGGIHNNLDLQRAIIERTGAGEATARRWTENIGTWLQHFDHYYQEVAAWELRRGRELGR